MATITDVRAKLAQMTLEALASKQIRNALTFYPKAVTNNMLPCFVVSVGAAVYDMTRVGAETLFETRTYTLVGFIAEGSLSVPGDVEQGVHDYFPLLQDYFGAKRRVTVGANNEAINLMPIGDSGIIPFNYAGTDFIGLRFDVRVVTDRALDFSGE